MKPQKDRWELTAPRHPGPLCGSDPLGMAGGVRQAVEPGPAAERVDVRRLTATNACLRCSRELEIENE